MNSSLPQQQPPVSRAYALGLALFSCVQNALIGGVIFGWAGIDDSLLVASPSVGGAGLTHRETSVLFSYGASAAMVAPLLLGPVLDTYGPRLALLTSHTLVLLGFAGFASSHAFWHFAASVVCMSFGGPGLQLAIIHVANLFPKNKFLAVSFLTGSITISFSMFTTLGMIWEWWGVGFRGLFGGYCGVIAASMVGTWIMSPDEPFELDEQNTIMDGHVPSPEEEYVKAEMDTYAHHHSNHMLMINEDKTKLVPQNDGVNRGDDCEPNEYVGLPNKAAGSADNPQKSVRIKDQPFYCQLKSATFVRAVIIFVTLSFAVNFTIASLNTELSDITTFSLSQRHSLSHEFSFLLALGMPFSVLVGFLMDQLGLEAVVFMSLLVGQISTVLILSATYILPFGNFFAMVCGFAVYSLFRQYVFVVFLSWISSRLGVKYFGILSGIGFAIAGSVQFFFSSVVGFLQNDYHVQDEKVSNPRWMTFHIVQICVLGILMVIPYQNYRDQQREQQAQQELLREEVKRPLISYDGTPSPTNSSEYGSV